MFKNSGITRAVRHCTNRYITQRATSKHTGIYQRLISNQSGCEGCGVRPIWPSISSPAYKSKTSVLIRRSLQTASKNEKNESTVVIVGLGALGLASVLAWKLGVFSTEGGSKPTAKEITTEDTTEREKHDETQIESDVSSSVVETELDEDTVLVGSVSSGDEVGNNESSESEQTTSDESSSPVVSLEEGSEEIIHEVEEETVKDKIEEIKEAIEEIQEKIEEKAADKVEEIKEVIEEIKGKVQEKAADTVEEIKEVMEEMQEKVEEKAADKVEEIKEVIEEIQEKVEEKATEVAELVEEITDKVKDVVEEIKEEVTEKIKEVEKDLTDGPKELTSKDDTVRKSKPEVKLPKIPSHVPYLIIGAGTASHAACRAIRKNDPNAKILVVGDEEVLPYMRPPLSKELWFNDDEDAADMLFFKQWNGKKRSVFFEDDTYYTKPQLLLTKDGPATSVLTGHKVIAVNSKENIVHLKHGAEIKYDKLLIATGGHPKNHQVFDNASDSMKNKFTLFRSVADYRKLDKMVSNIDSVTVIGGGFLGSELACALATKSKKNGMAVSQVFHEDGNMGKILPKYLSEWTTKKVENEGVKIYSNADITNAEIGENNKVVLELSNGEKISTGHVVVCVGIEPNTELASSAGLEVDRQFGGFRVNSELQAKSDIWIAGDVSCFYDEKLGRRRVEHHDHAVVSGRLAGENMTGAKKSYVHQSMFWSDLGPNVGYEAIGIVDNSLDTVGVWAKATKHDTPKAVVEITGESMRSKSEQDAETGETVMPSAGSEPHEVAKSDEEFGKGVVFYLRDNTVVGVLLWNVFNRMPVARKILKEGKKQNDLAELAKLFNIHE